MEIEMTRNEKRIAALVLLAAVATLTGGTTCAGEVEFVVGDLMAAEGGAWDAKSSPLTSPFGVDFNSHGDMWIVELEGGRVHRFDAAGKLHHAGGDGTISYKGDGEKLAAATFNGMHNCAVTPNGDLYIADSWNHCVRKVNAATGVISTIAGTGQKGFSGDGGPATAATFDFVMCITLNPTSDVLHIADLNNHRIRAVDLKSGLVTTVAGNGRKGVPKDGDVATQSPLVDPRAVAQDSKGNIWILERGGHAIRAVLPDGTIQTIAGTGTKGFTDGKGLTSQFGSPKHLCIDDADNVYIADDENAAIRRMDSQTREVTTVLGKGQGDARIRLSHPHGVTWENGWLYVVDMGNNRILRVKP
jgi:sugar lactone lactonase YvrE